MYSRVSLWCNATRRADACIFCVLHSGSGVLVFIARTTNQHIQHTEHTTQYNVTSPWRNLHRRERTTWSERVIHELYAYAFSLVGKM